MTTKIVSMGVLAGAYASQKLASCLTHLVEVNETDHVVNLLCKRVKVDSMCGYYDDENAAPTCKSCLKKWLKLKTLV